MHDDDRIRVLVFSLLALSGACAKDPPAGPPALALTLTWVGDVTVQVGTDPSKIWNGVVGDGVYTSQASPFLHVKQTSTPVSGGPLLRCLRS